MLHQVVLERLRCTRTIILGVLQVGSDCFKQFLYVLLRLSRVSDAVSDTVVIIDTVGQLLEESELEESEHGVQRKRHTSGICHRIRLLA